ncbi:bifunctional endoribonuclease/protein kinase ire1, partial [Tulasnella sp. 427]
VTITEPVKDDTGDSEPPELNSNIVITPSSTSKNPVPASSLIVSETVLGYGSHGTVVFQGSFQGRAVAVKRLLQHCVTLATREVNILQESDDHPNVIRYYFKEHKDNFLYIALELCPASLADVIESPQKHPEISATFDPKRALMQVTNGLKHLHSLKIVHRDIKPQNILISRPNSSGSSGRSLATSQYRMLISDFGLCRKLESDQTSFLPTVHSGGGMAAGTVGWRAPEILRGEVKLDEPTLDLSSGGTPNSSVGGNGSGSGNGISRPGVTRLTKSVDVFALGCLFYYTLTNGEHPYGERFEREVNIVKNIKNLERLEPLGEEGTEAGDLITMMLDPDPRERPDMSACLIHPFFWTPARRLGFLQDASDRFEIMCREPREPQLIALETGALDVVGPDWHKRLDKTFDDNLGKFRKYDGKSVQDLMRALRNKKHHYQDLPDNVKRSLGVLPEGFLSYFTRRFPRLFLHVYGVVSADPILRNDAMFRSYFDLGGD